MRAAAQAVRGGLSSRGSARVFKGVLAGVKISPRCQNAIYTRWHTRQAVAVTPTVHQRRHEPKPPFDHTCSTAPQPCDCSTTSYTFHCIIIYCCFTHFAYTINYGCWDLNNLQAAGFIFLAKLRVSNSIHQLLHLDMFFFFFFYWLCLCNVCSLCILRTIPVHTHSHVSKVSHWLMRKGKVLLPVDDDRVWWGLVPVATTLFITASTAGRWEEMQRHVSHRHMNRGAELKHNETEEVTRALQERKGGFWGRETFDLDFCWVSAGKTRAQALQ